MRDLEPLRELLERIEQAPATRVLAAVGYVPFLCFLPIFARREDEFARQHGKQSLILLAALVGIWVIIWLFDLISGRIMGSIFLIGPIFRLLAWLGHYVVGGVVSLGYLAAIIIGGIRALAGQEWRIPVISQLSRQLDL